jgi:succinate dehydrogenase / fumarate reductase cytochrome b subunit
LKRLVQAVSSCWLINVFGTSIGKKFVMAVTGLALCGFLFVHLGGNLLLYVGSEEYNHYAHALHAQKILLPIAEFGLLLLFLGHILLALKTNSENIAARPVDYAMKQSKIEEGRLGAPASSVMYATGIVVLLFLVLHLVDFKFELRHTDQIRGLEPFAKARVLLSDWITLIVYVVGSAVLGYHVLHGFQSAFQTLGCNHPTYTPVIRFLSFIFAVSVAVGFGSFPLWAWATKT